MYTEHTHPKYEEGMITFYTDYSVLYKFIGAKYESEKTFENYIDALIYYNELVKDDRYELIVLNENETRNITRLCKYNEPVFHRVLNKGENER